MTTKVPTALPESTVSDVRAMLTKDILLFNTINYVYIVDAQKKFLGVLSIKDLYRADPVSPVLNVSKTTSLISVRPESHQERAAYLAIKHNIKAVPVVGKEHLFLGSITSDTILSILHKETHEDILRRAGIRHPQALTANILETPLLTSFRHRVPWLFLGLLGGLLAAKIVGSFEGVLREHVILAAFIPLMVYMSDAVGTQTEAWVIRDLAIGHITSFRKYLLRHFLVTMAIACSFGISLFLLSLALYQDMRISMVLGLALIAAITTSVITGLIVPYIFSRLTLAPADPSGPLGTILQDILSIVAYFVIATLLL